MKKIISFILLLTVSFLAGCSDYIIELEAEPVHEDGTQPRLEEDLSIYDKDDPLQVHVIYLTVFPSPAGSLNNYTFEDVNSDTRANDEKNPELPVLFQEGNSNGPQNGLYGYSLNTPNGTIKQRGRSTRLAKQKSYKINLSNQLGTWLGFDKINLNKHPFDITRFRNKLAFDIIRNIDDLPSLRTKFMHVYVKDLSQGDKDAEFIDYGLFTHVEDLDADYLINHGMDSKGNLYKAENFFFQDSKDLRIKTDNKYDEDKFERILEIANNNDHESIIEFVKEVNNYFININTVVEHNLQIDNYLTWLAVNILLDNRDTNTQNFFLYRPEDHETFYFLPWDYDGAFDYYNQTSNEGLDRSPPWRIGLSNYWSVPLHSRFFRDSSNIDKLNKKIDALYYQISEMNIQKMIEDYDAVVSKYTSQEPDASGLRATPDQRAAEVERLKTIIDYNLSRYYSSLEKPMPIFLGDYTPLGEYSLFNWDRSYDFQNDELKYYFELSASPDFDSVVYEEITNYTEVSVKNIASGIYFWRVTVIDAKGNRQVAMDEYTDKNGIKYFGLKKVTLESNR